MDKIREEIAKIFTFDAFDDNSITASMVVDHRTHQPFGLLHGGASVVLAETLGSMASFMCIDTAKFYCVGLEVNANHLRGVRSGRVSASSTIARPRWARADLNPQRLMRPPRSRCSASGCCRYRFCTTG